MEFTCEICGKTKPSSEFRYIKKQMRFCDVCKECELKANNGAATASIRASRRRTVRDTFRKLCPEMSQVELDNIFHDLRAIWEEEQKKHDS